MPPPVRPGEARRRPLELARTKRALLAHPDEASGRMRFVEAGRSCNNSGVPDGGLVLEFAPALVSATFTRNSGIVLSWSLT